MKADTVKGLINTFVASVPKVLQRVGRASATSIEHESRFRICDLIYGQVTQIYRKLL